MRRGFNLGLPLNASLLRDHSDGGQRVTPIELFFDLVYVLSITQLSHTLLEHLDIHSAFRTLLLLVMVWRAWIYMAWLTNWFDPNRTLVRLLMLGMMLGGLIIAATIPDAFGDRGLIFVSVYVMVEIGRSLFAGWAFQDQPALRRNFQRILVWTVVASALWLTGGFAEGTTRELLWLAAVLVDLAGPASGFVVPGLGRSLTTDWNIHGGHMAERCQLFLIIALGESILVTGATFGELEWSAATVAAFVVAFIGSVSFWWIYFDRAAEFSTLIIERDDDPGRLGRSAFTYFHLPMVAGVIVTAVADELTIAHPTGHTDTATLAVVLGGPAMFLLGHALFKLAVFGTWSMPRIIALGALVLLVPVGTVVSPLALATCATVVVAAVAFSELRYDRATVIAMLGLDREPATEDTQLSEPLLRD